MGGSEDSRWCCGCSTKWPRGATSIAVAGQKQKTYQVGRLDIEGKLLLFEVLGVERMVSSCEVACLLSRRPRGHTLNVTFMMG